MKLAVRISCLVVWIISTNQQLGAEQLYGHDILLDEHTVLFTEGSKAEIEEDGGRRWGQRFPLIHIEDSDTCEILGSAPSHQLNNNIWFLTYFPSRPYHE
jgi:hypothetical protein